MNIFFSNSKIWLGKCKRRGANTRHIRLKQASKITHNDIGTYVGIHVRNSKVFNLNYELEKCKKKVFFVHCNLVIYSSPQNWRENKNEAVDEKKEKRAFIPCTIGFYGWMMILP